MLGDALLDRDTPVDAVFLGRIVARRLVVRAAVVPDHDVALSPRVTVRGIGPDHAVGQLFDDLVALALFETFDAPGLAGMEVGALPAGLRTRADDRVEDGGPGAVPVGRQRGRFPAGAGGEGPA